MSGAFETGDVAVWTRRLGWKTKKEICLVTAVKPQTYSVKLLDEKKGVVIERMVLKENLARKANEDELKSFLETKVSLD